MNKIKELSKSSLEITYELFIIMIPTLYSCENSG